MRLEEQSRRRRSSLKNSDMAKWRILFDCGHQAIMTEQQLHDPIEQQLNPIKGHKEIERAR